MLRIVKKWPIAALLLSVIFFHAAGRASAEDGGTVLTGKVVPTVTRAVVMPFNGVVDQVLAKPGEAVEEGAPLLRFHLQEEAERMLQREVITGAGTEELKGQIFGMERELATLNAERNKTRHLVSSGLGSRQALARLEENVSLVKSRIELMRATIKKNETIFKARLNELSQYFEKPVKAGETLPAELVLTSPIKGYVLSLAPALNPGQLLGAGTAPIQVGQLNPVLIQIAVYEAEVNDISVGDTAMVEIPSLGNRKFKGIVNEISWISTNLKVTDPSYYTVEVTVPNPDLVLKPGFKAIVRFEGGKKPK